MILDGKEIAADILRQVRQDVERLGRTPVVRALVVRPTAATESYLRIKRARAEQAGMRFELVRMEDDSTTEDLYREVERPGADALIVQLPLPSSVDERAVLDAIPLSMDGDVLSQIAYDRFLGNVPGALLPPVVNAVSILLARAGVRPEGKRAVVVGGGRLVGAPVALWLAREGADVSVLTRETFEAKKELLKEADIIVGGAGSPHLITPDLIAPGTVCIDAGTSESEGAIVGDFDPECAKVAGAFSPVPGGVGPVAVACLFKNAAALLCP